jgi:hypothetical protein
MIDYYKLAAVSIPACPPNNKHHPMGGVFVCGASEGANLPRVRLSNH